MLCWAYNRSLIGRPAAFPGFPYFRLAMWPLFSKKKPSAYIPEAVPGRIGDARPSVREEQRRRPLSFAGMLAGMGDLGDLRNHDTALKFWLPEPADEALREYAKYSGTGFSEMLREFFGTHCYGIYAMGLLRSPEDDGFGEIPAVFRLRGVDEGRKVRKTTYWVPELGKNVAPVKIWVAKRLRDDLQALADHVKIPLSQYLREIAISRLLGHGMLPKRPEMLEAVPLPSAQDWCEDKEVPWVEVDAITYARSTEGRKDVEWED